MTREEAIDVIENRFNIMDYCESRRLGDALDMAVDALNSENSLIDRVLEIIEARDLWERREGCMWAVNEEVKQAILALKGGEQE